jgi:ABC-type glutathione transport system ATPase component
MPRHAQAPDLQAQPMVVAQGLALAYPDGWRWPWQPKPAPALQPLDLCLRRSQRIGVVGSSGSGKSTLARGLLRVLPPVAGSVNWWGTEVTHRRESRLRALRPHIQMVFQDPYRSLDPLQRVDAMLAEAIGCRAQEPEGTASPPPSLVALLESVGLDASALSRYPSQFSGGQRQRLAIARALATNPDVLVCDEATSALDLATQAQILELLDTLIRARQLSLILIAHDLAAIERLCDTLLVLDCGRLVEQGSPAELYANPRSPALRALLDARMLS